MGYVVAACRWRWLMMHLRGRVSNILRLGSGHVKGVAGVYGYFNKKVAECCNRASSRLT